MFFKILTDVAIGAPGEDGSGAVYIYHGSSKGIETQYRQVCFIKLKSNSKEPIRDDTKFLSYFISLPKQNIVIKIGKNSN